jgi:hypothetical protein
MKEDKAMRSPMRANRKPNLWKYTVYEALLLLAVIALLFMLPELGKFLQH